MNLKIAVLTLSILALATLLTPNSTYSLPQPTITFNPKKGYPSLDQAFTVNASVSDVVNLSAWQLVVGFNPTIINCTSVTIPPENIFDGNYILFPPEIDNKKGVVKIFCVLDATSGVNGSGNLCQINFRCLTPGVSALEIIQIACAYCGTYLQEPDYDLIPFIAVEGMVEVTGQGCQENWYNLETQPILVFSNSTIAAFSCNETWKQISFTATGTTGTYGSTTVVTPKSILNGTKIIVLIDSSPILPSLSKNETHNFIHFIHQHSTKNIKILVTLLGDINGDRKVRVDDVLAVALAFGKNEGDPGWDPRLDLTNDGKIRVDDILLVAGEFGKNWTP